MLRLPHRGREGIGGPFPAFRGKSYVFPAFRSHFFLLFFGFCHFSLLLGVLHFYIFISFKDSLVIKLSAKMLNGGLKKSVFSMIPMR